MTAIATAARVLAGSAAALVVAHAGPALSAIGPLRRRLLPATSGIGDPGHVALTFDDGPHPEATPELLRLLDNAGVRATFFLLGEMAENHPSVTRAIAAAGHEIGVHGYEHRLLLKRGPTAIRADLTRATSVIADLTGVMPRWWRPPYGVAGTAAVVSARRLGLTPVLWTCWGRDWTYRATPDSISRAVLSGLIGGGTILLHDSDHCAAPRSWEATLGALPAILSACRARRLDVGPLAEHFAVSPGPRVHAELPQPTRGPNAMRTQEPRLTQGWGRATGSHGTVVRPVGEADWQDRLATAGNRGFIARGGGRGYGDAAQNAGGIVALTNTGAGSSRVTVENGTVTVDAGMALGPLVRALAPLGWTLPVLPGTGWATVGGAIAADVHGKNHVHHRTFGSQVQEMTVLTTGLGPLTMGPRSNPDAFWATVGGLGLTGVIRQARLNLVPLDSWLLRCTDTFADDLGAMLTSLRSAARDNAYAVGWIDAHRRGRRTGGGIISTAQPLLPRHNAPPDGGRLLTPRFRIPVLPGSGIGTSGLTAAANQARLLGTRLRPRRVQPLPNVLFPLDAVPDWPGLHGRRGLVQYQFVVPFGAEDVLAAALTGTRLAGSPATLAVLKVFGASGQAPLSFPMPGWSLALDFPADPALRDALDALDARVAAAGGRVYLVKDSRLRPELLDTMYPHLARWRAERAVLDPDAVLTSDLSRRLRLSGETGVPRE